MKVKYHRDLKTILFITIIIILVGSLEALINSKSIEAYDSYREVFKDSTFRDYMSFVIINYFITILEPIIISLFLFLTYNKIKLNWLYALVFGGMILIKIINILFSFNIYSIFYYLILGLYIILFIFVIKYSLSSEAR